MGIQSPLMHTPNNPGKPMNGSGVAHPPDGADGGGVGGGLGGVANASGWSGGNQFPFRNTQVDAGCTVTQLRGPATGGAGGVGSAGIGMAGSASG